MKTLAAAIPFAGAQLSEARHICAFFKSDEEQYRVLLPFIKDGFERGDKAVHVVHPDQSRDHLARLAAAGVDAAAMREMEREEPAKEIRNLQRCINDLVSVFALPAIWSGGAPLQIAGTLLDGLLGMVRLDLAYFRFNERPSAGAFEQVRVARSQTLALASEEIGVRVADRTMELARANEELRKEIAERKLVEEKLRREEEQLKRSKAFLGEAQRLSSTGSFSWRVATDEIVWSEQLYRLFEFDQGVEVTLELIGSRVHPEDFWSFQQLLERARRDGGDLEYEHRLYMPDRSTRHLHLVAHGTRDAAGRLEYIGAVQDVTQRRRSEEALGKARSELTHMARVTSLGALSASIVHEVSQPLSGIITNASTCLRMLATEQPDLDGARETVRRTLRDGQRASEVITRLRALFGKSRATNERVDLNQAAREVIALSVAELRRSRVVLESELADDLPPVSGDRIQLQQVILNLLLNASDAMSGVEDVPRLLMISTAREPDDAVRLSVRDVGIGVEPGEVERVFEEFYTTKQAGMGMGLSVSRAIIESHHGRIWAAPNEGRGATFAFSLPRRPERS